MSHKATEYPLCWASEAMVHAFGKGLVKINVGCGDGTVDVGRFGAHDGRSVVGEYVGSGSIIAGLDLRPR